MNGNASGGIQHLLQVLVPPLQHFLQGVRLSFEGLGFTEVNGNASVEALSIICMDHGNASGGSIQQAG